MKAAFCGTQEGMTKWQEKQLAESLRRLAITEILLRDYLGSDRTAITTAIACGIKTFHIYPINDSKKRAFYFPGIDRSNEWTLHKDGDGNVLYYKMEPIKAPLLAADDMIRDCEMLICTPKEFTHTLRSGTWSVVRKAWHAKKEAFVIPPVDREDEE